MTFFAKLLFVSASWCPVYLLVAVLAWDDNRPFALGALALAAASAIGLIAIEQMTRKLIAKTHITVKTSTKLKDDVFMYVLTYIPPFFAIDVKSEAKLIALLLLYVFIFASYVRLNQYHLNPLFVFFGYDIYNVDTVDGAQFYVITKHHETVTAGAVLRTATIGSFALVA